VINSENYSKLWIANIDRSQVATTDVYTYIGVVVNVLNEGLPRTAWLIIGDKSTRSTKSRLSFAYTMIAFQIGFGIILSTIFIVLSPEFASAFVPREARKTSIMYVRISSMSALSSAMEVVVGCCTRAMDKPNVPLLISSVKFVVNIILDMLFISKWHVGIVKPEVTTQALIRMVCDLTSASFGLIYFIYISKKFQSENLTDEKCKPSLNCLKILMRPAIYTFAESVIRNGIYLWLIRNIVSMGSDYSTAFGVFNSIRWGLVMVPVQALEASALTFVGHHWGQWRARVGVEVRRPNATNKDLLGNTE
jgi:Na+-driven multidrug efflux pump